MHNVDGKIHVLKTMNEQYKKQVNLYTAAVEAVATSASHLLQVGLQYLCSCIVIQAHENRPGTVLPELSVTQAMEHLTSMSCILAKVHRAFLAV